MQAIADQINNSPVRHISVIGGEPFVRKDLKQIISALKPDITLSLDTNGSQLIRNWEDSYDKRFLHVSIGFDGPANDNEIYRRHTNNVLEAIEFLVRRGVKVMIPTIVTRKNCHNIKERVRYIAGLGVTKIQINKFSPVYGARNEEMLLSEEQENAVLRDIHELAKENHCYKNLIRFSPWHNRIHLDKFARKSLGSCFCGYWKASISAEGNFIPCLALCESEYADKFGAEYDIPNLLKGNINTYFSESKLFRDVREAVVNYIPHTCQACVYKEKCTHGCRVASYFYEGALKTHDPNCKIPYSKETPGEAIHS